jgi:hypothetical protein
VTAVRGGRARQPALAAEAWLLAAAADADRARAEWEQHSVALFRCGGQFTAVRISEPLVTAMVGSDTAKDVADRLATALGGAVFAVPRYRCFYALTAAGQATRWREPDAEALAPDTYIGIPALDRVGPAGDFEAYWVVPMSGPGALCEAAAVGELVAAGRSALAKSNAADGESHG